MNTLSKLLNELCPDGVEYKTIDSISSKISSGGTPKTNNTSYYGGNIPWLRTQEVNFSEISQTSMYITEKGLENSSAKWIPRNCVIVAMYGATVGKVAINKIPLTTNQACCNIKLNEKIASFKYVYYCLSNMYDYIKSLGQGSQTNISAKIVKKIIIPIPPLPVQEEIVRILDNFTELTAELTARKKQYEYYRNLVFEIKNSNVVLLEDIAIIKARIGWQGLTKREYLSKGFALLVTGIDFNNGGIDFNNCHYVTEDRYEQDKNIQLVENDILVTKDGTLGKMAFVKELPKKATLNSGVFVIRVKDKDKVLPRYLYHYLNSGKLMNYAKSKLTGGTIKHLNQNVVVKTPVFLPSLEEQQRIVDILDRFDKLCNDISEGLPAEIEARQKQYEYYRDKLLTFKPLEEVK